MANRAPLFRIEGGHRLDEADGPDGDQVVLIAGDGIVLFYNVCNQSKIVLNELVPGSCVALPDLLQAFLLLTGG